MSRKLGNTPKKDILEILREAEAQNSVDMKQKNFARDPMLEKTVVNDSPETPRKRTKVTRRINAETAELIDKYSEHKDERPMSDTQKLREKLKEQNANSELLGYLSEENKPGNSERVEKLYEMINDARTRTMSEGEKQPPKGISASRFSDEAEVVVEAEYAQEQMFPLGDTIHFDETDTDNDVSGYDEDYEHLSEKVAGREISFGNEEESEGQVKFDTDGDDLTLVNGEALDETDINLRLAFDMMDDEDGALEKIAKKNREYRKSMAVSEDVSVKYTGREQNSLIAGIYRKRMRSALVRIIAVALFALGIMFLELATADSAAHNEYIKQGPYGVLYILIDLQLLFFIGIALMPAIKTGFKSIFRFRLNTESLLVVAIFFAAAYSLVHLFIDPNAADLKLYNLPAAFSALCYSVSSYMCARKDYKCFRILASKKPKYTACELTGGTREADEFYKYLFEDSDIYTVKRAKFVDGFVERTERPSKFESVFNFIVPTVFFAGVIIFVILNLMGNDVVSAYSAFSIILAASVPASSFFMISLPVISANRVGAKRSVAFVGNDIAEEYSSASVLSFADTEVYPSNLVKITNIRMYGDYRIDSVITDLAKVFGYVGGPLSKVLAATLSDAVEKPSMIRVIESTNDGLCVAMEGHNFFLGKRSYMRRYRFECPVDEGDEAYDRGVGSVMYVVIDEKLAAKLYVKYDINPLFDSLLKDMYKAGLCLGVKTLDPNINNEMINSRIRFRKCPISVLRGNSPEEVVAEVERINSGIVCNSSLHNFLKMFALCDKARHITKSNIIISVISLFLSFGAVAFLALTGGLAAITSLHAVAFQLFWMLPVWLISYLMM